jgi:hypothetical protein
MTGVFFADLGNCGANVWRGCKNEIGCTCFAAWSYYKTIGKWFKYPELALE